MEDHKEIVDSSKDEEKSLDQNRLIKKYILRNPVEFAFGLIVFGIFALLILRWIFSVI